MKNIKKSSKKKFPDVKLGFKYGFGLDKMGC